jgi:capsular exopolysaccharide synthesis family protein
VLTVTSASPGEGKTTVTSNLAIALAHLQQKVLLIDADLRKPRMHTVFGVEQRNGLSELLMARRSLATEPLDGSIRQTYVENLFLLPSGLGDQDSTATHLLYSQHMDELLRRVKQEFDMVLIDSPPMLQIPDARILGRLSDAVILVVRAAKTTRDTALAARQMFDEDGTRLLGAVLNHWDPKATFDGRYSYGYYERYYATSPKDGSGSVNGA